MKRIIGGVLAISGAMVLAGCSSATAMPDELQQWMDDQQAASDDADAFFVGLAGVTEDRDHENAEGFHVNVAFDEAARVSEFVFSCVGSETMDVVIRVETGSTATTVEHADVKCAESPTVFETGVPDKRVTAAGGSAFSDGGAGAWSLAVR